MNEQEHLDKELFSRFYANQLKEEELLAVLAHIAQCDRCASLFADQMEEYTISAPHYLKKELQEQIKQEEKIKPIADYSYSITRNRAKLQLFWYGCKVTAAAGAAILLLFSSAPYLNAPSVTGKIGIESPREPTIPTKLPFSFSNRFSKSLYHFSNKLLDMEVSIYDKEEK